MTERSIRLRRRFLRGFVSAGRRFAGAAVVAAGLVASAGAATLNAPIGVAVDAKGQIYVANLDGNNVTIYSLQRALIGTISGGATSSPAGVAVTTNGTIYVLNANPLYGEEITIYDGKSHNQTGFLEPVTAGTPILAITVDAANDLWVLDQTTVHMLDYLGNEIHTWDAYGASVMAQWSGNVELIGFQSGGPRAAAVNIARAAWLGDPFAILGLPISFQPGAAAEDAQHQFYETDPSGNRVVIFDSDQANVVGTVATAAAGYGIAVDSLNKRFYVAETAKNQVVVYSTVPPYKQIGVIK